MFSTWMKKKMMLKIISPTRNHLKQEVDQSHHYPPYRGGVCIIGYSHCIANDPRKVFWMTKSIQTQMSFTWNQTGLISSWFEKIKTIVFHVWKCVHMDKNIANIHTCPMWKDKMRLWIFLLQRTNIWTVWVLKYT